MTTVVIVIHLMIAVALVCVVLMQRSEGGALGIGGGGGGAGGFLTGRGTANLLTRVTAALALGFFMTSIGLSILAKQSRAPTSIFDSRTGQPGTTAPVVPGQKGQSKPSGKAGTGVLDKLKAGAGKARVPTVPQSK